MSPFGASGMRLLPDIKTIRVHGKGKWYRNSEGKWELRWFDIRDFEELNDASLLDVIGRLRAVPHNDLMNSKFDSPFIAVRTHTRAPARLSNPHGRCCHSGIIPNTLYHFLSSPGGNERWRNPFAVVWR